MAPITKAVLFFEPNEVLSDAVRPLALETIQGQPVLHWMFRALSDNGATRFFVAAPPDYDAEIKTLLIEVTSALNGRKRAFITFAAYVDAIKSIFNAADNELMIVEKFLDFNELIRAIKKNRSKRVFLSMVENFTIMRRIFSDLGLVEGKDFFNGLNFLAASHGKRFNSYRFVKVL